ncbi:MAG: hypothetical protein EXQ88_05635 [Alphaproteobacteria bacterium]|nr:hypothetical protein [Alphaproteobacteria bacterium]
MSAQTAKICSASLGLLLLSYGQAYAYVDQSTANVLFQLALGGLAGTAMVGRLYWPQIKAFLGIKDKPESARIEPE